ncbi:MAG: hypothetical protein ACRD5H_12410 [Nitrososphaerales archaeon]
MNKQIRISSRTVAKLMKVLLLISVVITLGVIGHRPAPVQSDTGIYRGPGGLYDYGIARRADRPAEIHVVLELEDKMAVERYRQASNTRAQVLLKSAPGERLYTVITFAKPLPPNETVALLKEAEVEPVSYTQVGWTAAGERMGSTIFASPDFDLEKLAREAISASSEQDPLAGARTTGFMVVDGYITISEQSLGRLLADERVYLVDTTAYEVQQLVGSEADGATFVLSTPFWSMDWGK